MTDNGVLITSSVHVLDSVEEKCQLVAALNIL